MEQGTIKKIIDKTTIKGKPYKTVLINDVWINSFSFAINETLKEGQLIQYELKQEGEYKNLDKIIPLEEKATTNEKTKIEEIHIQPNKPDKDTRISRLAVLNTSTEIHKQANTEGYDNKKLFESILEMAEKLEQWVNRWTNNHKTL